MTDGGLETSTTPIIISGCLGPRGGGYTPAGQMTDWEAAGYHVLQVEVFKEADADLVTAMLKNLMRVTL